MTITTVQDAKRDKLLSLGYSGSIPNMERNFYLDRGATGAGLNNLTMTWLESLGFTQDSLGDRWYAYLRSLGYSGSMSDMFFPFWVDFTEGPPEDGYTFDDYVVTGYYTPE